MFLKAKKNKKVKHPSIVVHKNPFNNKEYLIAVLTHKPITKNYKKVIQNKNGSGYVDEKIITVKKISCRTPTNIKTSKRTEKLANKLSDAYIKRASESTGST